MQNLWAPLLPMSSAKPPTGTCWKKHFDLAHGDSNLCGRELTRHVPHTNCRRRERFSWSMERTNYRVEGKMRLQKSTCKNEDCMKHDGLPAKTIGSACYSLCSVCRWCFSASHPRQSPAFRTIRAPARVRQSTAAIPTEQPGNLMVSELNCENN